MDQKRTPTLQDIETLTSYLPRLYAGGFSPVESWNGGQNKNGVYSLPYPSYHPLVEEFFGRVSSDGWLDRQYDPELAYKMLQDGELIRSASLEQIQTMLTFCVRGERFSDGHWGEMIEKGHIRRLLERLNVIKEELAGKARNES